MEFRRVELGARAVVAGRGAGQGHAACGAGRAAGIVGPPMKLATVSLAGRGRICAVAADGGLVDVAALSGPVSVTIEQIGTLTSNLRMLGTQETAR